MVVVPQHRHATACFDDSKEYYHYACGTGIEAGKWFVKHKVKCVVAMDFPGLSTIRSTTAMGKNGPPMMNLRGATGRPITEEYAEKFGIEAYAEFDKEVYIQVHGREAYDAKYGELEALGQEGTWEPCHKYMLGHGIVGVENLGGDLDKVLRQALSASTASRSAWYMGDGSMVRCVAEIDEADVVPGVPDRTYTYCGTGYGPASEKERYGHLPAEVGRPISLVHQARGVGFETECRESPRRLCRRGTLSWSSRRAMVPRCGMGSRRVGKRAVVQAAALTVTWLRRGGGRYHRRRNGRAFYRRSAMRTPRSADP